MAIGPIAAIGGILAKVADKIIPSREEKQAQNRVQVDLNREEVRGAPSSHLRLWRSFLGWVLAISLPAIMVYELALLVLITYWPHLILPPSIIKDFGGIVLQLLLAMLGAA